MRRTFEQSKEALEFMDKIDRLTAEQRDHMQKLIQIVVDCYLNEDRHGVLMVASDTDEKTLVLSINCDEMQTGRALSNLQQYIHMVNTVDAPPKEMMN
jgi:hypothetical protein